MSDRLEAERLLVQHLAWIRKAARTHCERNGHKGEEAEDFVSRLTMKLMEDDYAVIRKYRGESGLQTYLSVVIARQHVEFLRQKGGRWRPSAVAIRIGPPAPELEKLVRRQGYPLSEAGEWLRTSGQTTLSDTELARLLKQLPERAPRPVQVSSDTAMDAAQSSSQADEHVTEAQAESERETLVHAFKRAMEHLDTEERRIATLCFVEGHGVAVVARMLNLDPKPLYRRVERLRLRLRGILEEEGVRLADAREILGGGES